SLDLPMNEPESSSDRDVPPGIDRFLRLLVELGASDLHLAPAHRPVVRLHGTLRETDRFPDLLSEKDVERIAGQLAGNDPKTAVPESGSLDGAVTLDCDHRFRFNIYRRLPGYAIALRRLENAFRTLPELGLS